MNPQDICNFHQNVFGCCYIYIQNVKLEFTILFSFVNLFAFVCFFCITGLYLYVDFLDSPDVAGFTNAFFSTRNAL